MPDVDYSELKPDVELFPELIISDFGCLTVSENKGSSLGHQKYGVIRRDGHTTSEESSPGRSRALKVKHQLSQGLSNKFEPEP